MINKLLFQSIISKYYLGVNESVKWIIKNNKLIINFTTPTRDILGIITYDNFELSDNELAIFDTKKLLNLISICNGELKLDIEVKNNLPIKLLLADKNFNLTYALSDPLLISKTGTVNEPEWDLEVEFTIDDINNLVKAENALPGIDNMLITTTRDLIDNLVCEFTFGDELGHNNKITYQIQGDIKKDNIKLPFNSNMFRTILQTNKDMKTGNMKINSSGLMKLEFNTEEGINSKYFIVRKAETNY
jgi:hypothetical protein